MGVFGNTPVLYCTYLEALPTAASLTSSRIVRPPYVGVDKDEALEIESASQTIVKTPQASGIHRRDLLAHIYTLVAAVILHGPGLLVNWSYGSWWQYLSIVIGSIAEGFFLLWLLTVVFFHGKKGFVQPKQRSGDLLVACQAAYTVMACALVFIILAVMMMSFVLGDATFRSMSGGVGPDLWTVVAGVKDARFHAAAQFKADPWLARRRVVTMILCFLASLAVHALGQWQKCRRTEQPWTPPSTKMVLRSGLLAIGLYAMGMYSPVLHADLSLVGSFLVIQQRVEFRGSVTDKHSKLSRGRPNVIYIQHESLSGSLLLNTDQGKAATPFFQSLIGNEDFYLFDYGRSVSGDTRDALTSLMTGCLPFTNEGKEVAFGRSIGTEFRRLGYQTASFSSRKLDIEHGPWYMLHNFLTAHMDKVVDPLSGSFEIDNAEGSDDRKMMPPFESWVRDEVNGTFYAQFYQFNTHWPYVKDANSTAGHRYFSALETVDETLESIFRILNVTGHLENTIIVGSGDHGDDPMRSKYVRLTALDSHILHMPGYIYHPKDMFASSVERERLRRNTQQVVSVLDFFPTLQHVLYGGDVNSTADLRSQHLAANLTSDEDASNCVTGLDLLAVDIPDDRVSFGVNYVSKDTSRTDLWTVGTKDKALYYRRGSYHRDLKQGTGFYEMSFGNCTAGPYAYCVSEATLDRSKTRRYWKTIVEQVLRSPLVSESVKESSFFRRFRGAF